MLRRAVAAKQEVVKLGCGHQAKGGEQPIVALTVLCQKPFQQRRIADATFDSLKPSYLYT